LEPSPIDDLHPHPLTRNTKNILSGKITTKTDINPDKGME
jgi:hypothetical protein